MEGNKFKHIVLCIVGALIGGNTVAQQIHIVDSSNGLPIAEVNVSVGTKGIKFKSDAYGKLIIPESYKQQQLFVSHVGYLPLDTVIMDITPSYHTFRLTPKGFMIEEVPVYTGYQKLSVRENIGSVDVMNEKKLAMRTATNVMDRLDGMLSGVTFDHGTLSNNDNTNLRIRGLSSINGNKSPLIILDDFPYEGDMANISPDNIANITVLKDAAAASIWGARAGNGVIVITSKKASLDKKIKVNFQSNASVFAKPDLRYANTMTPTDFIEVEKALFEKGYYQNAFSSSSKPAVTPVVALLEKHRLGLIDDATLQQGLNKLKAHDLYDDLDKYVYSRQAVFQERLAIEGGSARHGYNLALAHSNENNELSAKAERLSLQFDQVLKVNNWLTFQLNTSITDRKGKSGKQSISSFGNSAGQVVPYASLADENGLAVPLVRFLNQDYLFGLQGLPLLDWNYYPKEDYKYTKVQNHVRELLISPTIIIKLPMGLEFQSKYNYQYQTSENVTLNDQESFYTRDLINKFTQIAKDGKVTYPVPMGAIRRSNIAGLHVHNVRNMLLLNRRLGIFELNGLAGMEIRNAVSESEGTIRYGFNENRYSNTPIDPTTTYPNFVTGAGEYIPFSDGMTKKTNRFVSYYSNLTAGFKNRYAILGSFRKDASNFFGVNTNNKWNPLWSLGASWDISKEPFYNLKFMPYLKLRGSYGVSGNMAYNMVAVTTVRNRANSSFNGKPVVNIANFENPDLKWESVRTLNLGLDFASKSNRLSGSLEWYRKIGDDLFGNTPVDYTTGIGTSIIKNVASMQGEGLDVSLKSKNIIGKFSWNTSLNLSFNKDKITKYYLPNTYGYAFVGNINTVSGIEGKPVYSLLSYKWAGLDPQDGSPRGYLKDELSKNYAMITGTGTDVNDLHYHGSMMPRWFGALQNELNYGAFSLAFSFTFKFDYFLRRNTLNYSNLISRNETHGDYTLRWEKTGDEKRTDIPAMQYQVNYARDNFYTNAQPFVYNASWLRLQYINLTYDLTPILLNNKGLRMQTSLNIENPGLLWTKNKLGLDPDMGRPSLGDFTARRVISLGVKINY
ncbi:MAG: hypothetical protein K0R59_553 [Sphingobacterium sp.]|jgi:TonB-linked SusC/RagA family outer membrane protein|nr:hypothetical protein [Sphingobacterium sp.]